MTTATVAPTSQWMSPVKNYAEVQDAWGGAVDVAAWWLNLFGEMAVNEKLRASIESGVREARDAISWTGTGALLWIRVVRLSHQDSPLRVTGVINDGPMFLAMGKDPSEALFNYFGTDRLIAGAPQGWEYDDAASYYIWVSKDHPNGHALPKGTMRDLTDDVRGRFSELAIQRFTNAYKTGEVLNAIVARAKQDVADQAVKDALDNSLRLVRESQQRVLNIQQELKEALAAAERASRTALLLSTLQGILTVAQLTQLAVRELNVEPAKFADTTTIASVLDKTETISQGAKATVVQQQGMFNGSVTDFHKYLEFLRQAVDAEVSPPPAVDQYLMP